MWHLFCRYVGSLSNGLLENANVDPDYRFPIPFCSWLVVLARAPVIVHRTSCTVETRHKCAAKDSLLDPRRISIHVDQSCAIDKPSTSTLFQTFPVRLSRKKSGFNFTRVLQFFFSCFYFIFFYFPDNGIPYLSCHKINQSNWKTIRNDHVFSFEFHSDFNDLISILFFSSSPFPLYSIFKYSIIGLGILLVRKFRLLMLESEA